MIREITKYVAVEDKVFVIDVDLFAGFIPPKVEGDAVVLRESGGLPNFYLPDKVEKAVQVLSRASDYWVASANAKRVYDILHGAAGITLPIVETGKEYYIDTAEATTAPQSLGQDEKGLFNISTNYIIRIRNV